MVEKSFLEYLNETGNIRLVIGNGFDLYCGLHTTYYDYYCKNSRKYNAIQRLVADYLKRENENLLLNDILVKSNIWDVFFTLHSANYFRKKQKKWCEIEKLILASLLSDGTTSERKGSLIMARLSKVHWPEIKEFLSGKMVPFTQYDKLMVALIRNKTNKKDLSTAEYYEFLLEELNKFEIEFGKFINCQIHDIDRENINSNRCQFINSVYLEKINDLLKELCPTNEVVQIDSFNYSSFEDIFGNRRIILNHINGSHESPIFGVDSRFDPDDPRFIFTKTSRRMDSKMIYRNYSSEEPFVNIVVFGHSLDEADYSYFFPIFDKINILDSNARGTLVFAFNVHGKRSLQTVKTELREGISKMLFNYAKDHQVANPNRFLDSVSTQKRVLFYEVKNLDETKYKNKIDYFEDEWQRMIENMEELELLESNESRNRY